MTGTAEQIAEVMLKRRDLVEKEFRQSSRGIAIAALKYAKQKLTAEIYAIPEDRTRKGKKKWRRTNHLRLRERRSESDDAYTVTIVNDAIYAADRHERGKKTSKILKYPPRNINPLRRSHWRDDLFETFVPIVRDVRHETILDILRAAGYSVSVEAG